MTEKKSLADFLFRSTVEYADEVFEDIQKRGTTPELPTGIEDLDELIWGLHKKELCIIAGRPSHGKSSIALQIAWNLAKSGKLVIYNSIEMSPQSIVERLFANEMLVNGWNLRKGQCIEEAMELKDKFRARLIASTFEIVGSYGRKIEETESILRHLKPDVLIVDHVQMISSHGFRAKYEALSNYIHEAQRLAVDFNCAMVVLSQMNRGGAEGGAGLQNLKGAGELEEAADTVLSCEWIGRDDANVPLNKYRVSCLKQRHGIIDDTYLHFDPAYYRFSKWIEPVSYRPNVSRQAVMI